MRNITQQVEHSSQEQTRGGRQISKTTEGISALIHLLGGTCKDQIRETEQMQGAVSKMEKGVHEQEEAVQHLHRLMDKMRRVGI